MSQSSTTDVWQRIQEAMRHSGRPATQVAVARLLGISQPSVSEWKQGLGRPKTKHLEIISEKTSYAFEYLATGRGPRLRAPSVSDDSKLSELLAIWDKLSTESREALLQHAKLMRTIQITADPNRVREFHDELQQANHRWRSKKPVRT